MMHTNYKRCGFCGAYVTVRDHKGHKINSYIDYGRNWQTCIHILSCPYEEKFRRIVSPVPRGCGVRLGTDDRPIEAFFRFEEGLTVHWPDTCPFKVDPKLWVGKDDWPHAYQTLGYKEVPKFIPWDLAMKAREALALFKSMIRT